MGLITNIIDDFKITADDLPGIRSRLFYDGPDSRRLLERFGILMFFATLIATYGVLGDSTATVIGAMLIAPLMTPVLAVAAAVGTGDMRRAAFSLAVVVGGVLGAIALAWWIGFTYRSGIISVDTNTQIVSRASPRLVDLYAALGAGAIGAFATSREDIADTLPGAAIAIALVPPLAVVGITMSQGAWGDAWGAMLLFLTNFFSILIAGGIVLALLGSSAAATKGLTGRAQSRAVALIAAGAILVSIPLAATSFGTVASAQNQAEVTSAVEDWLQDTNLRPISTKFQSGKIRIELEGEGEAPPTDKLLVSLQDYADDEFIVELEIIPSNTLTFTVPANTGN